MRVLFEEDLLVSVHSCFMVRYERVFLLFKCVRVCEWCLNEEK